jgi:hypothetical protein
VLGLEGEEVRVETEGKKKITMPRARVAVIAGNTDLVSRARPKGTYGYLILTNGSRLVVTAARLRDKEETLHCRLPAGGAFTVPADQVAALDLRQGCAVYLSDLKAARYTHTPFFGVSWPYVVDGSVANHDLRLQGNVYDKGLGMHSKSRLTYEVPPGARFFEAWVGLDEQTGRRGRARIQVLINDKPVDIGWNKELTARDKPLRIRLPLSKPDDGPTRLTLGVDFGQFGDVQGHVNWVDARIIK